MLWLDGVREVREDCWIMRLDPDDWTIVNTERDGGNSV